MLLSSKTQNIHVRCGIKRIIFDGNKNIISQALKHYRIKANLTQEPLAAQMQTMGVNIDQQMISKIEHNARMVTDYELALFCYLLKITPQQLLSDFTDTLVQ